MLIGCRAYVLVGIYGKVLFFVVGVAVVKQKIATHSNVVLNNVFMMIRFLINTVNLFPKYFIKNIECVKPMFECVKCTVKCVNREI
ncbi:hypothetical protein JCM19302_1528 [Jejuia pallidilutea]|uniref:Uncharacterized protein n=1 Tax=Jejuia pallidilutea TaxID=504487 RepID=A0A090W598_9FLAO|nr:hypothetical protein JCM19302_1528 [Jejuia pallidilutea]